jgi:hypothetical protein
VKYNLETLRKHVVALAGTKTIVKDSESYFQVSINENGTGSAILRFLPALPDEDPFIRLYNHAFETPSGQWFIEPCPTTLNLPCPVCEAVSVSRNGPDSALAVLRRRKMYFISNVLVVLDPRKPENEGKVFFYKYGRKIMDKIHDIITSSCADTEGIDPFDVEFGANLRLRVINTGEYPDYDKSSFDPPSPIGDEDLIAAALGQRRSLEAIIAPSQFKSYEELKRKFDGILGASKPV